MDRIQDSNTTPGGLFRDGDPATNTPATRLNALYFNGITEELRNVIAQAGITPDPDNWTQLHAALLAILNPPGSQIGYARTNSTVFETGVVPLPADDTIPQQTEGKEYSSLNTSYTPQRASSLLEVDVFLPVVDANMNVALFRDAGNDAIVAAVAQLQSTSAFCVLKAVVPAGSTTATTFKLRYGSNSGAACSIGGTGTGTPTFGAARKALMIVREIAQ